jgi:hypothetical protein
MDLKKTPFCLKASNLAVQFSGNVVDISLVVHALSSVPSTDLSSAAKKTVGKKKGAVQTDGFASDTSSDFPSSSEDEVE